MKTTSTILSAALLLSGCAQNIPVRQVSINPEELTIIKGETARLEAVITPENATNTTLYWYSSDESIATVDNDGNISGNNLGEATISVMAGNILAECTVTVSPQPAESITITPDNISLGVGESAQLQAEALPQDCDMSGLTWSSSDDNIASVDSNGKVTAIAKGEAKITACIGQIKAGCTVTVTSSLQIGDYYYEDGTTSKDLDESKKVAGVLFYINDDKASGLVVSLEQSELNERPYGPVVLIGADDKYDGENNQKVVEAIEQWETDYPVFKWASDMTAGGLEWYIPSIYELKKLYAGACGLRWVEEGADTSKGEVNDWEGNFEQRDNYESQREAFYSRIVAAGGAMFEPRYAYRASTEINEKKSYTLFFSHGSVETIAATGKIGGTQARAIAKVTIK